MNSVFRILVLALSLFQFYSYAATDSQTQKNQQIFELMRITNTDQFINADKMIETIDAQIKLQFQAQKQELNPQTAKEVREAVKSSIRKLNFDELKAQIAEIYDANYTLEEINGLIEFYKSPIGQKVLTRQEQVMMDVVTASRQFMMPAQKEILEKIKENNTRRKASGK